MGQVSKELEDYWAKAMRKRENNTRRDAEEKMFEGTALAGSSRVGNPLRDPLYLNDAQMAEREYIRKKLEEYRNAGPVSRPVYIEAKVPPSREAPNGILLIAADKYLVLQDREVYTLLTSGYDVRTVAARTHLTIEEVETIAQRHNIIVRSA